MAPHEPFTRSPRPGGSTRDPGLDGHAVALHRVLLDLKRAYQFRDRECICCYDVSVTQCWAL